MAIQQFKPEAPRHFQFGIRNLLWTMFICGLLLTAVRRGIVGCLCLVPTVLILGLAYGAWQSIAAEPHLRDRVFLIAFATLMLAAWFLLMIVFLALLPELSDAS